ncbi:MAG: 2,5-didehydrogluconate reductase [Chloroflexi bacterium 44-23]|nr:MAG: 2,5-didehydrogluconate reductase [Chloroflexi bacterium 44-23]
MEKGIVDYNPLFNGVEIGIGTWAWGDRMYWGYGKDYADAEVHQAFISCIENGITFFDTAEVYGQGRSEQFLGNFIAQSNKKIIIASKFMPFPWRLTRNSFKKALKNSLDRLKVARIDLYQLHMPLPPVRIEKWMEYMAEAKADGLIDAVGVSNLSYSQMQRAFDTLAKEGVRLASNQVEYSLINREIEKNGVLKACQEMGIVCIAYSPIGMGVLSGKYSAQNLLPGMRASRFSKNDLIRLKPLIDLLKKIGADHGGKSASQVAINWTRAKGTLPIPGVKNIQQAEQNTDVISWQLSDDEVIRLDEISDRVAK